MHSVNSEFIERMKGLLGDEVDSFLASLNEPARRGIVVNTNKLSVEEFKKIVDFDISSVGYDPSGFYIGDVKLGPHPLHHAGAIYSQDPGAMFTVNAYHFRGDERALDMCAAPGGKSIQIANRIPNGVLISNEINRSRSHVLYSNIERMGLKNVIITNETPNRLARAYADTFDVCLVDAPCSAEGMIRKDMTILDNWNENLTNMCATRQLEILDSADKTLKQGGILIYSTCTYSRAENEDVVREFIKKYDYELINIEADFARGIDMSDAVRLYPHKTRGEGQFVAVLRKKSASIICPSSLLKLKRNKKVEEFILECVQKSYPIYDFVDFSYIVPDVDLIRRDVNYVSIGVRVAGMKSNIVKPEHYLFSAFGDKFSNIIDLPLGSEELSKYLRGDIFSTNRPNGYGAILVCGVPLGGYRIAGGEMKNLYPKGLRNFN